MFPVRFGMLQNVQLKQLTDGAVHHSATMKKLLSASNLFKVKPSHGHDILCRRSAFSTGSHDGTGLQHLFRLSCATLHFGRHGSKKTSTTSSKSILLPTLERNSTGLSYSFTGCHNLLAQVCAGIRRKDVRQRFLHQPTRCMASRASKVGLGKGKKKHTISEDTASDDESDDDIIKTDEDDLERDWDPEIDEKPLADEQETGSAREWKEIQQYVPSLRLDAVLSAGLGVSRKKIEEAFLGAKLRVNGEKVIKKSRQVKEGDILDMILDRSTPSQAKEGDVLNDGVTAMRLHIMEISTDKTNKDRLPVLLRRWKNLKLIKERK